MNHSESFLAAKLLGSRNAHSLENRVFNYLSLIVVATGLSTLAVNIYFDAPVREVLYSLFAIIVGAFYYLGSLSFRKDKQLRISFVMIFQILLSLIWITNQGSEGSAPIFFIVLLISCTILFQPPLDLFFLAVNFIIILVLLLIERLAPSMVIQYTSASLRYYDVAISYFIGATTLCLLVRMVVKENKLVGTRNRELYTQTLEDKEALQNLIAELKVLRGIIPVCSFCKKIRNEETEWEQMETYITEHTNAVFSHGLCPDCLKKNYPEIK